MSRDSQCVLKSCPVERECQHWDRQPHVGTGTESPVPDLPRCQAFPRFESSKPLPQQDVIQADREDEGTEAGCTTSEAGHGHREPIR